MADAARPQRYFKIGEISRESGVGVEALRFYESRGLIEPVGRTEAGYRLYDQTVFSRLRFVKKAQSVGFSLDEIARIISESASGRRPCAAVRRLAAGRLTELEDRIRELQRYRRELRQTVAAWERQGETEGNICGLIEGLADPGPRSKRGELQRRTS